jgi:LmbE family N-acetylglucosaminyl deacetylase
MISAKEYCFFSPHLDDVVFSCGGFIAKLRAEKKKVLRILEAMIRFN